MGKFLAVLLFAHHRLAGSHADDAFIKCCRRLRIGFAKSAGCFEQSHLKISADRDHHRRDRDDDQCQAPVDAE
jgi:hypothetical protein